MQSAKWAREFYRTISGRSSEVGTLVRLFPDEQQRFWAKIFLPFFSVNFDSVGGNAIAAFCSVVSCGTHRYEAAREPE